MEKIKIGGMSCQHCVMSVSKALERLAGVKDVKVDLEKGEATFENAQTLPAGEIRKAVEKAGFEVVE
ncbi:MAG TPA: heavy metal-associated domain-containing protein [Thermodesulfobacteriota bacterium]|nr:heavy metal-associated domain-containing protein [Thermodesulfobacteriota bacterium]